MKAMSSAPAADRRSSQVDQILKWHAILRLHDKPPIRRTLKKRSQAISNLIDAQRLAGHADITVTTNLDENSIGETVALPA